MFFLLATNFFALLIPWLMKLAIEGLQHPENAAYSAFQCASAIALLALIHSITRIFSRTLMLNAARIIEFRVRNRLFECLMKLDTGYFSSSRTGDVLSRFSNDLTNVRMLCGFGVMSAINTLIIYIAALSLMWKIDRQLTFWAVLPFPVMIMVVKKLSKRLFKISLSAQEELANLSTMTEESISGIRVIKSFCREDYFLGRFCDCSRQYLRQNLRIAKLRGLIIPVMAGATGSGSLIVLFLGGRLVIGGNITLGDFVAFSGYLAMLVWPTAVMGWILSLAQRGAASMKRLAEILEAEPTIADGPEPVVIKAIENHIEFRNLTFSYNNAPIIRDLSLIITSGEKIGITGPVGSGKSTLIKLIPHLLPVAEAALYVDGIDINNIAIASLRNLIGYVPQEAFLFSRTIGENIGYALHQPDNGAIEKAAMQSGLIRDIAKFNDQFDTMVGEKGVALSGGQKQRLAIARALVTDPPLLILDDPLSSVDADREDEILSELGLYFGDRTVIIVSQRLSAFRDCQRVVVMENGRIAEDGNPAELLKQGGLYAAIHQSQSENSGKIS